ncbi:MAG: sigma 54-interacting transcriptional regulator, partial [Candidatus Zixiibacteriota bacterium]
GVLGVLLWRRGDYTGSEKYLLAGLKLSKQYKLTEEALPLYTNLCLLYFDLAEYRKAVKFGKLALKTKGGPGDSYRMPALYINIMISFARLGEYEKAEYWIQKYLTGRSIRYDRVHFRNFYRHQGDLEFKKGEYRNARATLHKALALFDQNEPDVNLGKLFQNLALLAACRGRQDECRQHLKQARNIFDKFGDHASIAETELIKKINSLKFLDTGGDNDLTILLGELVQRNRRYYAVRCLFFIMVFGSQKAKDRAREIAAPLTTLINKSAVPLFRAVISLIDAEPQREESNLEKVVYHKEAYRLLHGSGDKFLALLLCLRIGEYYSATSKIKLAGKFLFQARKLAESIENQVLSRAITEKIKSLPKDHYENQKGMIESVHYISKILQNIDNYELALRQLVEYAVRLTGAERGVLLLKSKSSAELQVKSFVNCDEQSLKDIRDFSGTVPRDVAEGLVPVVVDNALEDGRTKKYKSIILHNILSVICVPIQTGETAYGVLYLDHHTIPALFDKDDVVFVSSMANFMSVLLGTIQEFHDIDHTKEQLEKDLISLGAKQPLITRNRAMQDLLSRLPVLARSNASVLLYGESGTGKEILAQMIHELSSRADGPLLKLNCAAIPASLMESELFGVAKNTATGVDEREGKFSAADGGTLILDEIGDMPLELQSKVLRVLEYQEFERVGSNRTISTDIRFIYATNKDLKKLIRQGKFREDLYYRINTVAIEIPPLTERSDDIPLLIDHFVKLFSSDLKHCPRFTPDALKALVVYRWPGNVRELRNFVERCCILHPGRTISPANLPGEISESLPADAKSREAAQAIEKARIRELLIEHNWNQSQVARVLSLSLSTLRRRIKKYGLSDSI